MAATSRRSGTIKNGRSDLEPNMEAVAALSAALAFSRSARADLTSREAATVSSSSSHHVDYCPTGESDGLRSCSILNLGNDGRGGVLRASLDSYLSSSRSISSGPTSRGTETESPKNRDSKILPPASLVKTASDPLADDVSLNSEDLQNDDDDKEEEGSMTISLLEDNKFPSNHNDYHLERSNSSCDTSNNTSYNYVSLDFLKEGDEPPQHHGGRISSSSTARGIVSSFNKLPMNSKSRSSMQQNSRNSHSLSWKKTWRWNADSHNSSRRTNLYERKSENHTNIDRGILKDSSTKPPVQNTKRGPCDPQSLLKKSKVSWRADNVVSITNEATDSSGNFLLNTREELLASVTQLLAFRMSSNRQKESVASGGGDAAGGRNKTNPPAAARLAYQEVEDYRARLRRKRALIMGNETDDADGAGTDTTSGPVLGMRTLSLSSPLNIDTINDTVSVQCSEGNRATIPGAYQSNKPAPFLFSRTFSSPPLDRREARKKARRSSLQELARERAAAAAAGGGRSRIRTVNGVNFNDSVRSDSSDSASHCQNADASALPETMMVTAMSACPQNVATSFTSTITQEGECEIDVPHHRRNQDSIAGSTTSRRQDLLLASVSYMGFRASRQLLQAILVSDEIIEADHVETIPHNHDDVAVTANNIPYCNDDVESSSTLPLYERLVAMEELLAERDQQQGRAIKVYRRRESVLVLLLALSMAIIIALLIRWNK